MNERDCKRAGKMERKSAENIFDRKEVWQALALTKVVVCATWTSQTVENSLCGACASFSGREMKSTCFHGGGATEKCHSVPTQTQPHYPKYPTSGRSSTTREKNIFCEHALTNIYTYSNNMD